MASLTARADCSVCANNEIDATLDQGRGCDRRLFEIAPGEADVKFDVTTLVESQRAETGLETFHGWNFLEKGRVEYTNSVGTLDLLPVGSKRCPNQSEGEHEAG